MDGTVVRCTGCESRVRVPADKTAARCPKCKSIVRVAAVEKPRPAKPPPVEELEEVVEVVEEVRPRAKRGREDDEDDRPRRRRDEGDEDDRPRRLRDKDEDDDRPRRRKKREPEGDGPWLIGLAGAVAAFVAGLGGTFLVNGRAGLPAGQDGPAAKLGGLGFLLVVSLVLLPIGVIAIKNRVAYGRWGHEITGTWGVVVGFIQALFGGFMAGLSIYGLLTTLANGR